MSAERRFNFIYDVVAKGVFVEFNGRSHYIAGPFANKKKALKAAMLFCISAGWPSGLEDIGKRED